MKKLISILSFIVLPLLSSYAQDVVRLTMYRAANGRKTADGTVITSPEKQRICAVSRDLLKSYPYGTRIIVEGYGEYVVRDKMGPKHRKTIDILITKSQKAISKKNVTIRKQ